MYVSRIVIIALTWLYADASEKASNSKIKNGPHTLELQRLNPNRHGDFPPNIWNSNPGIHPLNRGFAHNYPPIFAQSQGVPRFLRPNDQNSFSYASEETPNYATSESAFSNQESPDQSHHGNNGFEDHSSDQNGPDYEGAANLRNQANHGFASQINPEELGLSGNFPGPTTELGMASFTELTQSQLAKLLKYRTKMPKVYSGLKAYLLTAKGNAYNNLPKLFPLKAGGYSNKPKNPVWKFLKPKPEKYPEILPQNMQIPLQKPMMMYRPNPGMLDSGDFNEEKIPMYKPIYH